MESLAPTFPDEPHVSQSQVPAGQEDPPSQASGLSITEEVAASTLPLGGTAPLVDVNPDEPGQVLLHVDPPVEQAQASP